MSSSLVPLNTHCAQRTDALTSVEAQTSSRWCSVEIGEGSVPGLRSGLFPGQDSNSNDLGTIPVFQLLYCMDGAESY
ncbi:hypothetical protein TNCV_1023571 [Trichonephila clavipes]|nr:hypothetical protein TNCV_1023571 [Trichonephila clavipes]